MEEDVWQVEYGRGGWIRVSSSNLNGWLYLRLAVQDGRPVPVEFYYDGRGHEVSAKMLRSLPLKNVVAFALDGHSEWLERSIQTYGPNLSLLASYFSTGFGSQAKHWVADSWRAQIPNSGVKNPTPGKPPPPVTTADRPVPLSAPENGLTDTFLRSVAENYNWALRRRVRPAPELARMAGVSPRTVHGWVAKARDRGIMPPARKGGVS
ncbi:MAG: hypothetical protein JWR85_3807 [Marmoricola sp.]|nr:hypothetical protein [Marmoricola sp.]